MFNEDIAYYTFRIMMVSLLTRIFTKNVLKDDFTDYDDYFWLVLYYLTTTKDEVLATTYIALFCKFLDYCWMFYYSYYNAGHNIMVHLRIVCQNSQAQHN